MPHFEVFIPTKDPGAPNVTLTVEAQNWIGALKSGLKSIGEGQESVANVMCDIKEDNSIHVTDVSSRRVFRLREVPAPSAAALSAPPAPVPERAVPPRPISLPTVPAAVVDAEPTLKNPLQARSDFSESPRTLQFPVPSFSAAPPVAAPVVAAAPAVAAAAQPDQHTMQIETAPAMPSPVLPVAAPDPSPPTPAPAAAAASFSLPKTDTERNVQNEKPKEDSDNVDDTQRIPMPELSAPEPEPTAAPAPAVSGGFPRPASTGPQAIGKVELKKTASSGALPAASAPTPRGVPAPAPHRPSGQFQNAPAPQLRAESPHDPKTDPAIGRVEPQKSSMSVTDAIAEVFDATQDLYLETALTRARVAEKMLDIALAHIPAESGTFYLADVNGYELAFAAVRGPKADELKRSGVKVRVGQGIIGFCAQEGVCLAVSDIQKDPRYYAQIATAIGYQPRDTVCASAEKDGRLFGALQLINSKRGFDAAHMEVARYIGLTAAALLDRLDG